MERCELDDRIWELHVPMLRLALSILKHPQNAEDAVSAAVVSAYQHLNTLRQDESLKPWLLKITARCCYDQLRRCRREQPADTLPEPCVLFEEPLEGTLLASLNELPDAQAQVLLLYYYEGFSVAEIAHVLGLPRPTVSMRMSRGRKRLKEMLRQEVECDE